MEKTNGFDTYKFFHLWVLHPEDYIYITLLHLCCQNRWKTVKNNGFPSIN